MCRARRPRPCLRDVFRLAGVDPVGDAVLNQTLERDRLTPVQAARRELLERELADHDDYRRGPSLPHAPAGGGLPPTARRRAQWRALVRLARAYRAEYLRFLAEETAMERAWGRPE